ncbi:hypothetical protein CWI42_091710 [Ordospora colligata]|uniref:Non-structural maintenance of chromosomes element 4 n=1 Tax=Ordospora colligata OC4 TaxID=1354746 RepID=A0A0B2UJY2_9MICR|nr:uncharacterized protein M896_091730 [Ordospora colligata OC4]KHN69245.1 hypothetical protein M896_091730 [Ordospora colligata OC4]TBU14523.1 hypothetical protein CWI40_091690 [Ordospora colligata]TBU14700.1 hypothetical protein CWI41_091720 [Ordospora colligata]TBU18085.1 hypothetical protein CWI42_091710 [Ordospora colligata]
MQDDKQQKESSDDVQKKYICLIEELHELREGAVDDDVRLENVVSRSNVLFKRIKTCSELKLDAKITAMSIGLTCKGIEKKMEPEEISSKMLVEVMCSNLVDRMCEAAVGCYVGMSFADNLVLSRSGVVKERSRIQQSRRRDLNVDRDAMRPIEKDVQSEEEPEMLCKISRMIADKRKIDYFELVVDPESFSKTVENILYFSLAMRSGRVCLKSQDNKLLACESSNDQDEMIHLVIEMTYEEYLKISASMKEKEADEDCR